MAAQHDLVTTAGQFDPTDQSRLAKWVVNVIVRVKQLRLDQFRVPVPADFSHAFEPL